jgi:hypothetical protein
MKLTGNLFSSIQVVELNRQSSSTHRRHRPHSRCECSYLDTLRMRGCVIRVRTGRRRRSCRPSVQLDVAIVGRWRVGVIPAVQPPTRSPSRAGEGTSTSPWWLARLRIGVGAHVSRCHAQAPGNRPTSATPGMQAAARRRRKFSKTCCSQYVSTMFCGVESLQ